MSSGPETEQRNSINTLTDTPHWSFQPETGSARLDSTQSEGYPPPLGPSRCIVGARAAGNAGPRSDSTHFRLVAACWSGFPFEPSPKRVPSKKTHTQFLFFFSRRWHNLQPPYCCMNFNGETRPHRWLVDMNTQLNDVHQRAPNSDTCPFRFDHLDFQTECYVLKWFFLGAKSLAKHLSSRKRSCQPCEGETTGRPFGKQTALVNQWVEDFVHQRLHGGEPPRGPVLLATEHQQMSRRDEGQGERPWDRTSAGTSESQSKPIGVQMVHAEPCHKKKKGKKKETDFRNSWLGLSLTFTTPCFERDGSLGTGSNPPGPQAPRPGSLEFSFVLCSGAPLFVWF